MRNPLDAWEEFWEIDGELNFCLNWFETNWIYFLGKTQKFVGIFVRTNLKLIRDFLDKTRKFVGISVQTSLKLIGNFLDKTRKFVCRRHKWALNN